MQYITFDPRNTEQLSELISCYKTVFAAPPWNEAWWTDALVLEVIEKYVGEHAHILLAVMDEKVIGFSWGATWTAGELSNELGLQLNVSPETRVAYLKDIGVAAHFRKQGVAQGLLCHTLTKLSESLEPSSLILARTLARPEPSVVYTWFPHLGFQVVAEYPNESERSGQVILGEELNKVLKCISL
jgi:ribosomal protein S18 acetylase RimI-like enzyme